MSASEKPKVGAGEGASAGAGAGPTWAVRDVADPRLVWTHHPTWSVPDDATDSTEGYGGSAAVDTSGAVPTLTITPPSKKDWWRRTFYEPTMIKGDASALVGSVPANAECTAEVAFSFTPKNQFDQCGLFCQLDKTHWLKTGIEFADGGTKLSVVCCNNFSDWSVVPWHGRTSARIRLHKIPFASSVVVEANTLDGADDGWEFIRICHLSAGTGDLSLDPQDDGPTCRGSSPEPEWKIGPFSACALEQRGCTATFTHFALGPRRQCVHEAEGNAFGDK